MQDMKKNQQKQVVANEDSDKKERRHIVTWTQEEDDILRKQIGTYGTVKWYTYLNSDFKKGGWSPEEDKLLCEAQKIFGNRWTEIAKVVSGRTDNAVKNRFSTLGKKKAKYEALAKENNSSYINSDNKRVILEHECNTDTTSESAVANKKTRRSHIPDDGAEKISFGGKSHKENGTPLNQQPRVPFAVLPQNSHNFNILSAQNKIQGTFLKKDDPKISALMQQAELLSSLALKVDAKSMDQSLENAWKVLQEFLNQTKKSDISRYKIPDLQLLDLKDLLEDLKGSSDGIQPCWRQMELYEDSPGSSEYSTGSTLLSNSASENFENSRHQEIGTELKSIQIGDGDEGVRGCDQGVLSSPTLNKTVIFPSCEEQIEKDGIASALSSAGFNSPLQATPLFKSLTTGIPSPQFSESERNFLMKTLGMESPSLNLSAKTSQPPLCKRTLLHSL
ncbi:hypothetical protein TanjilG_16445 [Lupinus angustifolius]|uniref:Uncharacterized protein n=1 Tax=Lupinus angustifolius TaxID=3871 RepID=A0A1J7IR87_LUPAN|nr:hypothetical protein TanjilG_16445 [Lupinus angustifolius]